MVIEVMFCCGWESRDVGRERGRRHVVASSTTPPRKVHVPQMECGARPAHLSFPRELSGDVARNAVLW